MSSISVDAIVSRFVLSGISDLQLRESKFLTELIFTSDLRTLASFQFVYFNHGSFLALEFHII